MTLSKPGLLYLVSLCLTGMSSLVFTQVTSWLHKHGELSIAASLHSC